MTIRRHPYNEKVFSAIKDLSQTDYIIRYRNNENVGNITRLLFKNRDNQFLNVSYDFKHNEEFLTQAKQDNVKTL